MFKICKVCRVMKKAVPEFFHRHKSTLYGVDNVCKDCVNSRKKKERTPRLVAEQEQRKFKIDSEIRRLHEEGNSMTGYSLRRAGYRSLVDRAYNFYGTWNKALKANGIEPTRRIRKFETAEQVAENYKEDYEKGNSIKYRHHIERFFGSEEALKAKLGLQQRPKRRREVTWKLYSKEELKKILLDIIDSAEEKVTRKVLDAIDKNIAYSMVKHYGSIIEGFSSLPIDFINTPRVTFTWTKENVKTQLLLLVEKGYPLNYTYMKHNHEHFMGKAVEFYGSWENLFYTVGVPYEYYREDTEQASYSGIEFEEVFGDILTDLGFSFEKYSHEQYEPDFVIGKNWIDAKLSEWSDMKETIRKYEPYCDKLTIVFLRGNPFLNKRISDKTRLVHVSYFLDKLPEERKEYFVGRLSEIGDSLISA